MGNVAGERSRGISRQDGGAGVWKGRKGRWVDVVSGGGGGVLGREGGLFEGSGRDYGRANRYAAWMSHNWMRLPAFLHIAWTICERSIFPVPRLSPSFYPIMRQCLHRTFYSPFQ
ncbi:hypothetical protein BaRGS_00019114 [Batillaria attramentaria]|uniref:Uncharacterized protein n=1 Tax=Batillaria attramentaria TaxID=370345 RepID=A0ABD0KR96_9CAEN